jgi:hypothetical protein
MAQGVIPFKYEMDGQGAGLEPESSDEDTGSWKAVDL